VYLATLLGDLALFPKVCNLYLGATRFMSEPPKRVVLRLLSVALCPSAQSGNQLELVLTCSPSSMLAIAFEDFRLGANSDWGNGGQDQAIVAYDV